MLEGNTEIGEDCEIGPNSRLTDTKLGNGVKFQTSTAIESEIGNETTVGPFAYIRPNCHIGNRVKVGDFVEVKNSTIGDGTKFPIFLMSGIPMQAKKSTSAAAVLW